MSDILRQLEQTLIERQSADPDASYVASLYARGLDKILEKVGEEATETLLAAKNFEAADTPEKRAELCGEVADLWFHSLIMLRQLGVDFSEIEQVLARRVGTSGLVEKAQRQ